MKQFKFFRQIKTLRPEAEMMIALIKHCRLTDTPYEGASHMYNDSNHFAHYMEILGALPLIEHIQFDYSIKNLTTNVTDYNIMRLEYSFIDNLLINETV